MKSNEILQKGVPAKLPLPIQLNPNDLISICKNTTDLEKQINNAGEKFYELVCQTYGSIIANFFKLKIVDNLEVYIDENSLEKSLILSSSNIFNRVAQILNDENIGLYNVSAIENAINNLNSLDENEIKKMYPILYSMYLDEEKLNFSLFKYKNNFKYMNSSNKIDRLEMLSKMLGLSVNEVNEKINNSTSNYDFKMFLNNFLNILDKLKNSIDSLVSPALETKNNLYVTVDVDIAQEDKEKLEMYIAYVYQEQLKQMKPDYQQEYLYYLSEYYFENEELINSNKKIFSKYFDKIIKIKEMHEDYKKILINNPKLLIFDYKASDFNNMNLDEVNEFISEYFDTIKANWDFFKNEKLDEEIINKIKEYYGISDNFDFSSDSNSKVVDAVNKFIEKKYFFDKTDPYYRISGKNSFDGYIGYIYSNGAVILEKFFENSETGKLANNQAIYVMDISEFYNLTNLSKTTIIANKLCKRFIHKGNWQEKIQKEISRENNNSPVHIIDQLLSTEKVYK